MSVYVDRPTRKLNVDDCDALSESLTHTRACGNTSRQHVPLNIQQHAIPNLSINGHLMDSNGLSASSASPAAPSPLSSSHQSAVPLRRPLSLMPCRCHVTHVAPRTARGMGRSHHRLIHISSYPRPSMCADAASMRWPRVASRARGGAAFDIPCGRPTTSHRPKAEVSEADTDEMRRRLYSCCTCAITCGGRASR